MNATIRKRVGELPRPAGRPIPELVTAHFVGVMSGLVLAFDHLVGADSPRYKIVDRELTRC